MVPEKLDEHVVVAAGIALGSGAVMVSRWCALVALIYLGPGLFDVIM